MKLDEMRKAQTKVADLQKDMAGIEDHLAHHPPITKRDTRLVGSLDWPTALSVTIASRPPPSKATSGTAAPLMCACVFGAVGANLPATLTRMFHVQSNHHTVRRQNAVQHRQTQALCHPRRGRACPWSGVQCRENTYGGDRGGFIAGAVYRFSGFISNGGGAMDTGRQQEVDHLAGATFWRIHEEHEKSHADEAFRRKFANLMDICSEIQELGYEMLRQVDSE